MGALLMLLMGVVAVVMVLGVIGLVIGLVMALVTLALKLLPVLLIGYIAVKLIRRAERPRSALSASERAWLDSGI